MDYQTNEYFKNYCYKSLSLLEKIEFPIINMYNDYEAVFIYFGNSSHVEFIIKNNILKLGTLWSYTVL